MIRKSDIERDIEFYKDYYDKVRNEKAKLSKHELKGVKLRAARHRNKYQYYIRRTDEKTGMYLGSDNLEKAKCLAQIEYYEKLEQLLGKKLVWLEKLMASIEDNPFESTEKRMSPGKTVLITNRRTLVTLVVS